MTRNLLVRISKEELDLLIDKTNDSHKYQVYRFEKRSDWKKNKDWFYVTEVRKR